MARHSLIRLVAAFVAAVCFVGIVGVAGVGATESVATAQLADEHVESCAAEPPADLADPDGGTDDVVGWVEGYWYNEPLSIDASDGLDESELEQLTKRTAARVETLRCHTFEELPPLEVVSREEYRTELEGDFEEQYDEAGRQFLNARMATTMLVSQSEDAVEVQLESQAAFPTAFYETEEDYMGFVTDNESAVSVDQTTLAHELTHAVQDQQFGVSSIFNETTNDRFISSLAVVEGDASYIDSRYEENCGGEWVDDCIRVTPEPPDVPNWGIYLNLITAYSTPLVSQTYETEGSEGVDELLASMPNSTVEAIYPERYDEFELEETPVEDQSSDDWERLTVDTANQTTEYDVMGQHYLTSILIAPALETGGATQIVDIQPFYQSHSGGRFNFSHPVTESWQGDRFYGYANGSGETAGVWKIAWEDSDSAEEFAGAYRDLLEYRGGESHSDYENVYTFENASGWEMAVAIEHRSDQLLIVTAPTVDELTAVHDDIELSSGQGLDSSLLVIVGSVGIICALGLLAYRLIVFVASFYRHSATKDL